MKDTTKAVVRTFFFLGGAYLLYMAFTLKPEPDEKWFLAVVGVTLLFSAVKAQFVGLLLIAAGALMCGFEYWHLSQPWIGINPDLGGYVWGLGLMIIGGVFLTFAPSKKKKDDQ